MEEKKHGQSSSFRQGGISADANEMRRSTRRGSLNSHASASTWSWIVSNQTNPPPPPPVERSSPPFHGPRPLPDPFRNTPPAIENDEGDDLPIGLNSPVMQDGQQPVVLSEGGDNNFSPTSMESARSKHGGRSVVGGFMSAQLRFPSTFRNEGQKTKRRPTRQGTFGTEGTSSPATRNARPRYLSNPSIGSLQDGQQAKVLSEGGDNNFSPRRRTSMGHARSRRGGRSIVGGFMSGQWRFPSILRIGGQKTKRWLARQGTFGTDISIPSIGMTTGNTLPRYMSNPSIGPSNPQFAHRLSIAIASGALPPDASPSSIHILPHSHTLQQNRNSSPPPLLNNSFMRHPEPTRPNFPTIMPVTLPPANETIIEEQISDLYDEPPEHNRQFEGARATVMLYDNSNDSHESHPNITPAQSVHAPGVSYAYQPSPRTSNRIRDEPPPLPATGVSNSSPPMSPPQGVSSAEGPKDFFPRAMSRHTTMAMASHYDPSFTSHLNPVEKFFKGLYNLPWVARERVTIDYRPGDSNRAKIKVRGGVKKPMASWYRAVTAVVSRSPSRRGSRNLDLLSNGTGSASASTSLGNSLTPITSRRSECSSNNIEYQTSHQNHRDRKKHHHSRGTTLSDPPPQRKVGPLLPGVYPYPIPPPYPYTYPYGSYPPAPMPVPPQILTVMMGFFFLISLFLFLFIFIFLSIFVLLIVREG